MKECDLVLKGGVTSGLAYPQAISKIGEHYRLRSIGGTSAGSMAAALAAAAEYRRQTDKNFAGYEKFKVIDAQLASDMRAMLQPSEALAPLYQIGVDYLERDGLGDSFLERAKNLWKYYRLLKPYRQDAKPAARRNGGAVAGGGILASFALGGGGLAGAGLVGGVGLYAIQVLYKTLRNIQKELQAHDFGVLPGTTQGDQPKAAIIDWLADRVDEIAGNWPDGMAPEKPLTAKDLRSHDIKLSAVTTDLSSRRPFQLPFSFSEHHYFREHEMNAVIPPRVVRWMIKIAKGKEKQITIDGRSETLYPLPDYDNFPVILTTRMSMSFPGLIQAVPLWRVDKTTKKWARCLFSDGGISSNLPVHMFDDWLPDRPTFAVSLGSYDEERHGRDNGSIESRVRFSDKVQDVLEYPAYRISGILGFLGAMFYSAKDWQDNLQSNLTGFRERVAEILLDKSQGGLNLDMSEEEIRILQSYGKLAGEKIVSKFDFDENRYRRALSILPILGSNLAGAAKVITEHPPSSDEALAQTYLELLQTHASDAFEQSDEWRDNALVPFVEQLAALGATEEVRRLSEGKLPHTDAKLSLTATPEMTRPQGAVGQPIA
ncbi:patatin-like phospholipase family protein [uncultured Roseobacter sp.]|uniref:patatin-like phospholipase family protein n=1 Tax=uncultured Roseobacter sp. TaxID=114847 RepID=UPI002610FC24|nr:patatin-like phospholipase family protein [uncultured Roseobacter sp.]